ncbi:MerR family transcriptional regulator [Streptomyces sp. NPDC020379]|uniref:MerR family transcriptional regulator n=1 Tax=Streptomyces sp. NPDC020379 TaxID=3365071 RepID=UPI003790C40E
MAGIRHFKSVEGNTQSGDVHAYYPGSSRRIRAVDPHTMQLVAPTPVEPTWDAQPRLLRVGTEWREFFTIGQLASALHRSPVTIRKWESSGIIPAPTFVIKGKSERGNRRLYTREQVEGILRIADEEGILHHQGEGIHISDTKFSERVIELFHALAARPQSQDQAA